MDWEEMYSGSEQVFSGNPNAVLVTEVTGLPPGQALDVGCGEGADSIWLARNGWQVTAVDVAPTALRRGVAASHDVAERIAWTRADLTRTPPPARSFDLVSVQYFPLLHQPDHRALHGLLSAVAPGGTLLVVSHDPADLAHRDDIDIDDYYQPPEIADLLDATWTVVVSETRRRTTPGPPGTNHTHDVVLRARRYVDVRD
jgi:SAM-dependent methyltransferase